ncbi:MAG: DNA topoisomerase 4 subunit A [Alphaproteobacteria bacterium MarineAlpha5_Bin8]|nr:MAG: DNA topoisomerase 4 subunit A [Alphaproteobacteria bacterium MarineAlpha5_Bin8]PPR45874.1 MAG: DNA topoisomerase 4 subunit A [Alphaproteobacteria bacterium MarineAlpha5_Bin7]|tara:strand:+ start:18882 stop:21077 length:2196 start_codon:yes stop_codon:yes gene_type:complete
MTKIIKSKIDSILSEKYLSYAVSTIISRSLPDVRDGLKPVHRRIIYSMYQLKLLNDSTFKKCARIVGDVMGKFHPHGDQAIYDSLVRLAQDFSTRAPLIEGQGNFGNIDGDNAAAMRYTEARLDKISNYFFDGIEENAVDFKENYDGQNLEPQVLPTKLPNILLNGASGIAVGMATNIPPHNLTELNNALIKIIKNPSINLSLLLKEIKGPDFPTGGEILISSKELSSLYRTGKGSFVVRSIWQKEDLKNGLYQLIITQIPYQVNKTRLIEQLANLINNKKIPLDDILDESDENIRIVLKPKNRNINHEKLIELCFKFSDLSIKYSCNFNVLEDGIIPKQLGLKSILNNFLEYRKKTIKRKSLFNKEKITKKLKILNGYIIAYKNLDAIIKIIRNKEDPKKAIIKKYKLSELQTDAILNMRLGSLKKLDEITTKNEIKELKIELSFLEKLIKNKNFLDKYIIEELNKTNKNVDQDILKRRSKINNDQISDHIIDLEEFQEVEKLTVILFNDGTIKTFKDHLDDNKLKNTFKNVLNYLKILSNQKILLFVSSGRVFTIDPSILPSGKSNPKNFIYYVESNSNDKIIGILTYTENLKCIVASKFGKGFLADLSDISTSQKKGKQLFNLKNEDQLIKISTNISKHIACLSSNSRLLIFKTDELPILKKGAGVLLQKVSKNYLSDIQSFELSEGISWKYGKIVKTEKNLDFWIGKRSQVGKKVPKRFNKELKFLE